MPEIARFLGEFHGYFLFLVTVLRVDVHHSAFPLFLGEAVYQKNCLSALDAGRQGKQRAIHIYGFCDGDVTEGEALLGAAIHVNWNREWEPLAASFVFHALPPGCVNWILSTGIR